jgi:predicted nucleotidyltransferase
MGARYPARAERLERLREELRAILPRLVDADTEKVILFGSTARGDVGSTSDLDLLVVRRDARAPAARLDDLYRRIGPRIAVDLLVYTPEELEAARHGSSFLRSALRDGEVLYDRSQPLA